VTPRRRPPAASPERITPRARCYSISSVTTLYRNKREAGVVTPARPRRDLVYEKSGLLLYN